MKVVTVATDNKGYFKWLIESCKRHNYDLTVLGYGEKWRGFAWRFKLVMNFLHNLPPDEVVCFIDAYDVIMINDAHHMEAKFKQFQDTTQCKVVIAKENFESWMNKIVGQWLFGKCKDYNINAGTYIGYAKDIIDALSVAMSMDSSDSSDDQKILSDVCRKYPSYIAVDHDNIFFYTYVTSANKKIDIQKFKMVTETSKPCIFHAPLNGNLVHVLRELGYSVSADEERVIEKEARDVSIKRFLYYAAMPQNIIAVIAILLIVCVVYVCLYKMKYR
jgi:hypothetical protein